MRLPLVKSGIEGDDIDLSPVGNPDQIIPPARSRREYHGGLRERCGELKVGAEADRPAPGAVLRNLPRDLLAVAQIRRVGKREVACRGESEVIPGTRVRGNGGPKGQSNRRRNDGTVIADTERQCGAT